MATCNVPVTGRRRTFWATQPDACGSTSICGSDCSDPGLKILDQEDGRTIDNSEWVRGLALNMLLTDARKVDSICGTRPGAMNGHWSESFNPAGRGVGTSLRDLPAGSSIDELIRTAKAYAQDTLQKLVEYNVAVKVEVETKYLGGNTMSLSAIIYGRSGIISRVGLSGSRLQNSWAWN